MNRELRLSGKQKIDRSLCLKNYAVVNAQGCTSKVDKKQKSELGRNATSQRSVGLIVRLIWSCFYEGTLRRKCEIVAKKKGKTMTKDVI